MILKNKNYQFIASCWLNCWPKIKLGRWSVKLIVLMPLLFYVGFFLARGVYQAIPAGRTIPEDVLRRPLLSLTMLVGMASGVGAFILGFVAITTRKDRSICVYVSTLLGMMFTFFLLHYICEEICFLVATRAFNIA